MTWSEVLLWPFTDVKAAAIVAGIAILASVVVGATLGYMKGKQTTKVGAKTS